MLGKQTKDQNAELDLLLSGYSVEPYGNMTISRGQHQLIPCISLLLMCQPFILRELITNEEAFERGMTARLLFFVIEPENIPEDDGAERIISEETKEQWYSLVRDILNVRARREEPKKIVWTKEAREVFRKFHNESVSLRNGIYRDIEGQIGRWRENAIRIGNGIVVGDALTGHGEPEVGTEEQAMRAVEIARWCGLSSLSLINAGRVEKRIGKVRHLQRIIAENKGQVTFGALKDRNSFNSREIESLVAEFPSELLITDHKPKNGRPTRILTIPTNRENESKD